MKNKVVFKTLLSLPKTIFFNFRYLPFKQAIKFPFFVFYNVKTDIKGKIHLDAHCLDNCFSIRIGGSGSEHIISNKYTYFKVGKMAQISFEGSAWIAEGSSIRVDRNGQLVMGDKFSCNKNCNISCSHRIVFGKDNLLGWNIFVRDTDGHRIYQENVPKESSKDVIFGEHVWICSFADILKGAYIPNGCVVAWKACVLSPINEENVLIAGFPAKVIKRNIRWEK